MPTIALANNATHREIVALRDGAINVDTYGAVGNGTADDSTSIVNAVEAAGADGVLIFTAGKTYRIEKSLYARPGQIWIGYGATIKRANEISSALTSDVSGGSSVVVPVTDGSKFQVGQEVAGWEDDTTGNFSSITYVTAVNGNNVTIANLSINLATASSAVLTAVPIPISGSRSNQVYGNNQPDEIQVLGLTFDGNRTNNQSSTSALRWELMREISSVGDNSRIVDCTFNNAPAEGVVGLGDFSKIVNCSFNNINGNAIHLSAGNSGIISACTFNDCNTLEITPFGFQTDGIGHQDGAISFSNGCSDWLISSINVDTALTAVGGIGGAVVPLEITGVKVKDCDQGPFEILSDGNGQQERVLISDCNIENCGTWTVQGSDMTASGYANNILFSNINMNRTKCTFNKCRKMVFKNCLFTHGSAPVKISSISTANPMVITTQQPHQITNGSNVRIWGLTGVSGNDPTGNRTATVTSTTTFTVPVDGTGFSATLTNALTKETNITDDIVTVLNSEDCTFDINIEDGKDGLNISGGTGSPNYIRGEYKNNYDSGITVSGGTANDITDISVSILSEAECYNSGVYAGIQLNARAQIHDCIMDVNGGQYHIQGLSTANAAGSTVISNQFYGSTGGYNIQISAAAIDWVLLNNVFEDTTNQINDATSTGTTITHDNYVIGTDTDITPA